MTYNQINQLKEQYKRQFSSLLRMECDIINTIKNIELELPRNSFANTPEILKLKQKLLDIEKERRKLCLYFEEKINGLETKLLELVNKHDQLEGNERR